MQMDIVDLTANSSATGVDAHEQFALDVLTGLCSSPKQIPAKYFYDDNGSRLFQQIMHQEEYYLSRAELAILDAAQHELPKLVEGENIDIIELGPGDGAKSRLVISGFLRAGRSVNYYPIDISAKALDLLANNLPKDRRLSVHGIIADYTQGLRYARALSGNRQLVLFLGSNIGNFDTCQSQAFLRSVWASLAAHDRLIVGFDLKKDVATLTSAYNDSGGHTRAFNLNLLRRINKELGADFDLNGFQHFGVYNPVLGAMESYLLSVRVQEVYIAALERSFGFEEFEPLHLEYSFKFLEQDIERLCDQIGFGLERNFYDPKHYVVDSLWSVHKNKSLS
ncbi:MAG: L-histidine N(alpha)-methyltransferase [Chromatiales bacterium]|nr:L-histidine N(alpha)-methyltransferase [Chromatiales bacterium]